MAKGASARRAVSHSRVRPPAEQAGRTPLPLARRYIVRGRLPSRLCALRADAAREDLRRLRGFHRVAAPPDVTSSSVPATVGRDPADSGQAGSRIRLHNTALRALAESTDR